MNYYLVCPVGVIAGKEDLLTYTSDELLAVGVIVVIPFGTKSKHGVVIRKTTKPSFKTKPVTRQLDESLPEHLIDLALWISDYYAARLSIVFQMMLPTGISKKRRTKELPTQAVTRDSKVLSPTDQQSLAIDTIWNSKSITHLLHGITGSGKTLVYQELSKKALAENKSVLVLVPEISLTPQLAAEFENLHEHVLVQHSGLTEARRHTNWQMLRNSENQWIVVGPRSALFSPVENIGLIVVDECHEPSYQQDSQPKYSALRVARKLAELSNNAKLVLGSATPLITDYFVAQATNTPIIELKKPTKERRTSIEIVDMRDHEEFGRHPLFSKRLLTCMQNAVSQNEQVLLFHNRRGTARMSLCSNCGWVAECPNCHIPLRLHHDHGQLRCHVCGITQKLPQTCPICKSTEIDFKGFGSKRIEVEVRKLFPDVKIARFDSDTPASEQVHNLYQELYDNKISIIIGTQGIAKGLDLPNLSTVGIVHADSELFIPDFSSNERSFQLTTQVIGRAGRNGQPSQVIIQTLNPDHPAITHAKQQDFNAFYKYEVEERRAEHTPPHTYLLHLTTGYSSVKSAEAAARKLSGNLKAAYPNIHVRGPSPAFHEHRGNQHYQQLVVSCSTRSTLVEIAKNLPQRWQFTLDPLNLL